MKRLITGIFAAAMLAASPVWAHGGGHGHGDNDERHGGKHLKHMHKHKHKHHRHDDVVVVRDPRVVERVTVIEQQPVFVQPEPAPVNIVIPLR
jgi:hypothetical protein